jgi:hypothetical protein
VDSDALLGHTVKSEFALFLREKFDFVDECIGDLSLIERAATGQVHPICPIRRFIVQVDRPIAELQGSKCDEEDLRDLHQGAPQPPTPAILKFSST